MASMKKHNCSECAFVAKSAGGLTSHKRRHKAETTKHATPIEDSSSGGGVCHSCHALPIGSVELVSLLLVLIFSLTAVLLTSVYAIDAQNHEITALESQLN